MIRLRTVSVFAVNLRSLGGYSTATAGFSFVLLYMFVCLFIYRYSFICFSFFFFQMFLGLESDPPLVVVGILLFGNWLTNYRPQSWFPRCLELSTFTGERLLNGRSLPLPKRRLRPFLRRQIM